MTLIFMNSLQAQPSKDTEAHEVQQETKELLTTLKQYSFEQRNQAVSKANQAIEKLDNRIDHLENEIDDDWDSMSVEARKKSKSTLKVMRKKRNDLAEWAGNLRNSTPDAWDQMKKGFSDAYQSLSDSWKRAKNEYDTNNK